MCILVLKKAGANITKKRLQAMYDNNPDGAGFAYVNTDYQGRKKLITYKHMDFNPFYKKLRRAERNNPESNFLIHTRIATSGELSTYNCHPFQVSKTCVMGHNGIISSARKDPDNKKNDTQMFIGDTVQELPEDFMYNEAILKLMGSYIGLSKLVFLNIDNDFAIVNEGKGDWIEDVWYSNTSYKPRVTYVAKPYVAPKPLSNMINLGSKLDCGYCGESHKLSKMTPYRSYGFNEIFCKDCNEVLLAERVISPVEKLTMSTFIYSYNTNPANA